MRRGEIELPPVFARLAGWVRRGGALPARLALVLATLALASCAKCDAGCIHGIFWSAVVPEGHGWEELAAGSARVCRNDECVSGELSEIGSSRYPYAHLASESADGTAHAQVHAEHQGSSILLSVDYQEDFGSNLADGDRYTIEILAADGTTIMGLAETAVAYDREPIRCNDLVCLTVSLEGNTL